MTSTLAESPPAKSTSDTPPRLDPYTLSDAASQSEGRNFVVIVLYQIIMRTGWIFKTESIVMPAVLDMITGGGQLGGALRGCLPILNRLGHSIPPMLFARRLQAMPQKHRAIFISTLCMSAIFFVLAGTFWVSGSATGPNLAVRVGMSVVFLVFYLLFFAANGITNLSMGTLQGKLIYATRRGRLLRAANVIGAITAIATVSVLMPLWLTNSSARFDCIFSFTALCFAISAGVMLLIREPADKAEPPTGERPHVFAEAIDVFRHDRNFRRLALVAMAFGTSLALFPHYQALARDPNRLGLELSNLMIWVIVQNAGTAIFSQVLGPLADRRGNRLVMKIVLLVIALMPFAAIGLSYFLVWGALLFPLVFMFIGLTPVGFKTLSNYTLEISHTEDHPRYLSTLGICFALPLLASPLLGWVVEATSFEIVFFSVGFIVFLGWLLAFRLREPREALLGTAP